MAREGVVLRHDIAVPVSRVPDLIKRAGAELERAVPGVRIMPFGHLGDGNIHYNLLQPAEIAGEAFHARRDEVQRLVLTWSRRSAAASAPSTASAASSGPSWRGASRRSSSP
jgi:FAD/FMN-containing dehydrogenase